MIKKVSPFLLAGFVLSLAGCVEEHSIQADLCLDDPDKEVPGICGCGIPDTDTDGNTVPDCMEEDVDFCPEDSDKILPGICGCGTPDVDADGDGAYICHDECDDDPEKTKAGICGCGVSDADSDGDGTPDCQEECDLNPSKTEPGVCGCELSDADSDGDGTLDCLDLCPQDPEKTEVGICGCGLPDVGKSMDDDDGDGVINCMDLCPDNPIKTTPGKNGCKANDSDGDGVEDDDDTCPHNPNKFKAEDGDCNYNSEGVFEIWSTEDLTRLEAELHAQTIPAHRPGMTCSTASEILCESAGNSATYSICQYTNDVMKYVESQCPKGYVCGLDDTSYTCIPEVPPDQLACTEMTDPPQVGNCCDDAWSPVCAEGKLMSCVGDRLEETTCEFGCADDTSCALCLNVETPSKVGDCCTEEWAPICTDGKRLSCVDGKLKEIVCEFGCAEDATCNTCHPTETPTQIGDCCTEENYPSKCDNSGMMACVDGRVTRVECMHTCYEVSEETHQVDCRMTTDKEMTYFKAKVMRDLEISESIMCDFNSGNWTQKDLYRVDLDGQNRKITFTSDNTKRCAITRPLFNQVVESYIHDLKLDFDLRGMSEGAFASYFSHSTMNNVTYEGTVHSSGSIYGEMNTYGTGVLANYAEYSTFTNIGMTGSLNLTFGHYYGLIARMYDTQVDGVNVVLNDVQINDTGRFIYATGVFGYIGQRSKVHNVDLDVVKLYPANNHSESWFAGVFNSTYNSSSSHIVIQKLNVEYQDIILPLHNTNAYYYPNSHIFGIGYSNNSRLEDIDINIVKLTNETKDIESLLYEGIDSDHSISLGFYSTGSYSDIYRFHATFKDIQINSIVSDISISDLDEMIDDDHCNWMYFSSPISVYGLTYSTYRGNIHESTIQISNITAPEPISNISCGEYHISQNVNIYGLAGSVYATPQDVDITLQDLNIYGVLYGLGSSINSSTLSNQNVTLNNIKASNVYGLSYYINSSSMIQNPKITMNNIEATGNVYGLCYNIYSYGVVTGTRITADHIKANNIYYFIDRIDSNLSSSTTYKTAIHDSTAFFTHTHANQYAFAIGTLGYGRYIKNIAVYADAHVKKQSSTYYESSLIRYLDQYASSSSYYQIRLENIVSALNLHRYTSFTDPDYTYYEGTNSPMVLAYTDYNSTSYQTISNVHWLKRNVNDSAALSNYSILGDSFSEFSWSSAQTVVNTLNDAATDVNWKLISVTEDGESRYIPWIAD